MVPISRMPYSAYHLLVKLMVRRKKIRVLDNPYPRLRLETNDHLAIHDRRRKQLAPGQKPDHFIPKLHNRNDLTNFISKPVLVLKSIPTVFHRYLGQLSMEIMAADSESIWQNICAIEDKDPFEIHHAVGEDPFPETHYAGCEFPRV